MSNASGLDAHLEAAAVESIPDDRDTLRYQQLAAALRAESRERVDLLTAAWNAAATNDGRVEALRRIGAERGLSAQFLDAATAILERFDGSHQRLALDEIESALDSLGVGADNDWLNTAERQQLDRDGYLDLGVLLDDETVERMRDRYDEGIAAEGREAGHEVSQTRGIGRMSGTVVKSLNHDGLLDVLYSHPRLLAAARHVLGGHFKLSSTNYHCPLPGFGQQAVHADFGWGVVGAPQVVNTIWMLDDFTLDNGPTRVVPGTHRSGEHPNGSALNDGSRDPFLPTPGETYITGRAGNCMVYNAHLWHSGTQNRSGELRRAQHVFYTRSFNPTQMDMLAVLDPGVHRRLSRELRAILDVPAP